MSKFAEPLIEMLDACEKQFRFYAEQHSAKGTVDGAKKAQTNLEFAMRCRNAVAEFRMGIEACPHEHKVPFPVNGDQSELCLECGQMTLPMSIEAQSAPCDASEGSCTVAPVE